MEKLQGELVRLHTKDELELQGLFYEPKTQTDTVLLHLHGWTGNFYENIFLDFIARELTNRQLSFLSFNTREAGFIQEFLKKRDGC